MIPVCPRCDKAMFILEYQGVAVDFCHHCRGLWLDAGELELLLADSLTDAKDLMSQFQNVQGAAASKGERMLCPRCDRRLLEIPIKGGGSEPVIVDRCPENHGLWFDRSELQQLLQFVPASPGGAKTVAFLNELLGEETKPKG